MKRTHTACKDEKHCERYNKNKVIEDLDYNNNEGND